MNLSRPHKGALYCLANLNNTLDRAEYDEYFKYLNKHKCFEYTAVYESGIVYHFVAEHNIPSYEEALQSYRSLLATQTAPSVS